MEEFSCGQCPPDQAADAALGKLRGKALRKDTGSFSETHPYVCILGCGHLTAHAVPLSLLAASAAPSVSSDRTLPDYRHVPRTLRRITMPHW